jgi:hypothetical protein
LPFHLEHETAFSLKTPRHRKNAPVRQRYGRVRRRQKHREFAHQK